jgi:hypothetical protein
MTHAFADTTAQLPIIDASRANRESPSGEPRLPPHNNIRRNYGM